MYGFNPSALQQELMNGDYSAFTNNTGYVGTPEKPSTNNNVSIGAGSVLGAQTNYPSPIFYDNNNQSLTENPNNVNVGAGGGSSTPSYNPDDLSFIDTQLGLVRQLLNGIRDTEGQGLTKIGEDYERSVGKANTDRGRAMSDYQMMREDTTRGKQSALGTVDQNASTLAESLRRMLGMASGSNSSAYKFAAPGAVAQQASTQRQNVLGQFGENERNLAVKEKRAGEDFDTLLGDLLTARDERKSGFLRDVNTQKQDILGQLSGLQADRESVLGGSYQDQMRAQQPYQNRINDLTVKNNTIFDKYQGDFQVKPVNVEAPQLGNYTVDRQAINANKQSGGQSPTNPYSFFLKKKFNQ